MKRIRIAQLEQKDWKRALQVYLLAYRTTPHATTGRCPSELLFGREIRTKLPNSKLPEISVRDEAVRDRDSERKLKMKDYVDSRRRAAPSVIQVGDQVLLQQRKINKMSTPFEPVPYVVISREGNSVVVQSQEGVKYRRNVSHVKKFLEDSDQSALYDQKCENKQNDQCISESVQSDHWKYHEMGQSVNTDQCVDLSRNDHECENVIHDQSASMSDIVDPIPMSSDVIQEDTRPRRQRKAPVKFKDYVWTVLEK